jgi:hypothetical protein
VPVVVALGRYNVGYGTFALMESLPNASGVGRWRPPRCWRPDADPACRGPACGPKNGRGAALLLLSYYLPAAWATKRRKHKYLLYAAPFEAT